MGKILPVLLAVIGLGAGVGGGIVLRPGSSETMEQHPCSDTVSAGADAIHSEEATDSAQGEDLSYVKLNNQFVIPVVNDGKVVSLVVMAISVEINSGGSELVYKFEPKLRDAFLQVLFNHANNGGFDGNFTSSRNMGNLRTALFENAQNILGPAVSDILVVDIVRQDT